MHRLVRALTVLIPILLAADVRAAVEPIRLHPDNPHYFLWRGRPTMLITSGEHYGALMNLDFDYRRYLAALERDGMNSTRTFTGAYAETGGSFNIERNTMNPAPGRFICPWARSGTPGYGGGGNKFDLARWDEAYFERLRDFMTTAGRHGVVVELNLFCPMYEESMWAVSPMNARNNVNGVGDVARTNVYTLDRHGGLLPFQETLVRKLVAELRDFDNLYYEICNEPYFGGVTIAWQHHIADVIQEAQEGFPHRFLISRNVANGAQKIEGPYPAISIFNFHYATPPDAVALNYGLNKVIGDNETGFRGTNDVPYRMEAWDFLVAGGALFNHLDYSFTAGHEDGTFVYPASQPGGGTPELRRQFRILRDFLHRFDFIRMRPANEVVQGGAPAGGSARVLAEPGRAYAVYLRAGAAGGPYSVRWTGTLTPRLSEEYTFYLASNDGVRLWLDGKPVVDHWVEQSETESKGTARLEAGRAYPVRLEYFYNGGQAAMKLRWSSPGQPKEVVPETALALPGGAGRGLQGEYLRGREFNTPWATRNDPQVDFAWGGERPLPEGGATNEAVELALDLPSGEYSAEWVDTKTGAAAGAEEFAHAGGARRLRAPPFVDDIALRVVRK